MKAVKNQYLASLNKVKLNQLNPLDSSINQRISVKEKSNCPDLSTSQILRSKTMMNNSKSKAQKASNLDMFEEN